MDEGNGTPYIVTQVLRIVEPGHHQSQTAPARHVRPRTRTRTARPAGRAAPRHGPARRGERARARVVHRPPLTGFTSGVHEVHLLIRLRSSSIPGTELSIDSLALALIVGFKFF